MNDNAARPRPTPDHPYDTLSLAIGQAFSTLLCVNANFDGDEETGRFTVYDYDLFIAQTVVLDALTKAREACRELDERYDLFTVKGVENAKNS